MTSSVAPAFIISLDFELHWGVTDKVPPDGGSYRDNLVGARSVVPELLDLFDEFSVGATWATVGKLFFDSRDELRAAYPSNLPSYDVPGLSTYGVEVGSDETSDPLHFGQSLVHLIQSKGLQELASHTFSHFYCEEAGQTVHQFRADMEAFVSAARNLGITTESLVFPRNQYRREYLEVLNELGLRAYRGNQRGWMYRSKNSEDSSSPINRIARLADSYLPISGRTWYHWSELERETNLVNVPASQFLRPYSPKLRRLEPLRLRRIQRDIRACAANGGLYHLWWHPHNFGINQDENLSFLRSILMTHAEMSLEYGMRSMTMAQVACEVMQS